MGKAHRPLFIAQLDHALRLHRAGGLPWELFERRIRTPRAARWPLPLVELGLAKAEKQIVSLTSAGCFWAGNISEIFAIAVRDRLG